MKTSKLHLISLLSPAIFAFIFKSVWVEYRPTLIENFLVALLGYLILVPLLFSTIIKSLVWKRRLFLVVTVVSAMAIFVKCIYYDMFGARIGASTLYFLLKAKENQSVGFFLNSLEGTWILLAVIFFVLGYISAQSALALVDNMSKISLRSNKVFAAVYALALSVLVGVLYKYEQLCYNTPYLVSQSIEAYLEYTSAFQELGFAQRDGYFQNLQRKETGEAETFVIIIGESTTRNRMSLYGYSKNTNPKLCQIENELAAFTAVITPHLGTILSLGKVLTTLSMDNTKKVKANKLSKLLKYEGYRELKDSVGSVVQLYNKAGFKTFWLSNHRPIGIHENLVTEISKGADIQRFINIASYDESTPNDEALLAPLQEALTDQSKKKVIFLHLLGTHMDYQDRYPEEFEHFEEEEISFFEEIISAEKSNAIKAVKYDNAVRYNDYVVREIIERVRAKKQSSFVLYFSDHGEEVAPKDPAAFGRSLESRTRSMYEIPLILWRSPKFKAAHKGVFDLDHKFMSDDLIHAIADLSNISFDGYRADRSLFNPNYCEMPRMIFPNCTFEEDFERRDHSKK